VYPLIPITISVFGARGASSRRRSFALSLTYVLGIAVTYTALGLIAASFGTVFGGIMQNVWVLVGLAAVFVLLGLASLGAIELALPSELQTRLSETGGAGYGGALSMGLVAGLIAAPCVGPIVAGILVYVAQQGSLWLGGLLLFDFAMGLGVLFVVLGTFSGLIHSLPKSGAWMDGVKAVFAMIFFGIALYYLQFAVDPLTALADGIWKAVASLLAA
jgi:thiol:disulfide interchange protein DsbD